DGVRHFLGGLKLKGVTLSIEKTQTVYFKAFMFGYRHGSCGIDSPAGEYNGFFIVGHNVCILKIQKSWRLFFFEQ
ncbi:MAG: hypothetical protein MIO92_00160, partial [Methanosarcinaceae archaeon]|nr:hypothetical protein [Methanosarcinaceae archaeon]